VTKSPLRWGSPLPQSSVTCAWQKLGCDAIWLTRPERAFLRIAKIETTFRSCYTLSANATTRFGLDDS
jgi:hypothetical protein